VHTVGLVVIRNHSPAGSAAKELIEWLRRRNKEPIYLKELEKQYGIQGGVTEEELARRAELMVVLGGDGTFLAAAHMLRNRPVPIFGVNFGALGFLTEVSFDEMYETRELALTGALEVRERMMIEAEYMAPEKPPIIFSVMNDIVISKSGAARIIDLKIKVHDIPMTSMRGDGLIISTPSGSTAYNLSAGGPIVHPGLGTITLTPICPHSLTFRPVIVPAEWEIIVELQKPNQEVIITADGQAVGHFDKGGRLYVRKSHSKMLKVLSHKRDYFSILRNKLGWGDW
jgi:NAD+ kinase